VVRFSLDADAIGRNNPFSLAFLANVKLTLGELLKRVKARAPAARTYKMKELADIPHAPFGQAPMHPDELGHVLEEMLDGDAILVSENLSGPNQFFSTGFRKDEKTWISNSSGSLGWGIGAAIGAKLAAPRRQVVCNIGDGSVMYSAAGFWTQARYDIPVLTVVCNNRNYQTVRSSYFRHKKGRMFQSGHYPLMHLGDPDIDFVELARSQGVQGSRVERQKGKKVKNSEDLRQALKKGIAATRAGRPYLVEVVVAPLKNQERDKPALFDKFSLAKQIKDGK
jgi:thiamine pyrophosphate-dependent acetolactate synthase large subunit-like protein